VGVDLDFLVLKSWLVVLSV
jgi:hypothetical protein